GRARGVALRPALVAETMALVDRLPPEGTTSLQRDLAEGRPSELEAWNGAVVRLGRDSGVATPVNEIVYASQLPAERQARGLLHAPATA
ncbi:MAG: ketopantoate reductase C-terminal domain-containing protein, partial [Dongiaceae bacterium]